MNSTQEIAGRFREVILNGTWIANTNYKNELTGLDWKIATAQHSTLNTIAALVQHVHYYIHGVLQVLKGGSLTISDKFSFDFPPVASQAQWEDIQTRLWTDAEEFAALVAQMPGERLDQIFTHEQYGTYRRNIEAMIEHSYYHLGQIVLLKKMSGAAPNE